MIQMNEQTPLFDFLTLLKKKNDLFYQERAEMRTDFLLRGICEKEVDGLLNDPSLFPTSWLPETLCWDFLLEAGNRLPELLHEAVGYFDCDMPLQFDIVEAEKIIKSL